VTETGVLAQVVLEGIVAGAADGHRGEAQRVEVAEGNEVVLVLQHRKGFFVPGVLQREQPRVGDLLGHHRDVQPLEHRRPRGFSVRRDTGQVAGAVRNGGFRDFAAREGELPDDVFGCVAVAGGRPENAGSGFLSYGKAQHPAGPSLTSLVKVIGLDLLLEVKGEEKE
jgi:hypothetical protein